MITKQCNTCKITKKLTDFNKNKLGKYGRHSTCRLCKSIQSKKFRDSHKELVSERGKKYRATNSEKTKARSHKYYVDNREKTLQRQKEFRENNYEHVKEIQTKSRNKPENKKRKIEQNKLYKKTFSGKISQKNYDHKRRIKVRDLADGTVVQKVLFPLNKELSDLLKTQDNKCFYCSIELDTHMHLDHYIPLSKGGTHSIDNVVWACPSCNIKKGSLFPKEFLASCPEVTTK